MTVQYLIDKLEKFDRNATVVFAKETVCANAQIVSNISKKYGKILRDGQSYILNFPEKDLEEIIIIE